MKLKALMAGVLAAASILSLTACDESAPVNSGAGNSGAGTPAPGTSATTTTAATTRETFEENSGVNEAVKDVVDKLDIKDVEVGDRTLTFMAWWPMDETTAEVRLFKEAYGVDSERVLFENINVPYAEAYARLGTAISSGDSPDFFPFEVIAFPNAPVKRMFQPIDDIVDLNNGKWDGAKELIEQFKFGGKHYCAFYEVDINQYLWYRTSVIEDAGLEDPRELFEAGNWTWDTFLEMGRKFQTTDDDKYLIDGYNVDQDFAITTGVPFVSCDGTTLVNNLKNPEIERVMTDLISVLQKENLRYPLHELNGYSMNTKAWVDGDILFYCHGSAWAYQDTLRSFARRQKWEEDELSFVPVPKDPKADKYYVGAKPYTMLWVEGSENGDLVGAWYDACITAAQDPETIAAGKAQRKENYGYSDENLDYVYKFSSVTGENPLTGILSFMTGLGSTVYTTGVAEDPAIAVTRTVYLTGEKTYTQLREENDPIIQAAIDELNAKLAEL